MTKYVAAKTGEYPSDFPQFLCCEKYLKDNKRNSLYHRFPRASFSVNCSLLGVDHVRGQISGSHILAMNGGYCNTDYFRNILQNCATTLINPWCSGVSGVLRERGSRYSV